MAAPPPPLPNFQPSDYPPPPQQQQQPLGSPQSAHYYPPPPPQPGMASPQPQSQSQPSTPYYPPPPGNPPPQDPTQSPQAHQQNFYPPPPAPQAGGTAFSSPPPTGDPNAHIYHNQAYNPNRASLPPNSPPPQHQQAPSTSAPVGIQDTVGKFNGGSYRIDHRDSNSLLTIQLAHGAPFHSKPGAMVAMSPTVTLKGQMKFSLKKLVAGGDFASSLFTGPGELLLAPPGLGDIVPIRIEPGVIWSLSKDGLLAYTDGVIKDHKAQGFGKAVLSGEGLFVYKISGNGILFVTSLGAIIQKNLQPGEQYIVDNNHLVAWNCKYQLAQVTSGGLLSSFSAAEGVVCKFSGPGTVFIQTRNPAAFGAWVMGATTAAGR